MDFNMFTHIAGTVLLVVLGFFSMYMKTRGDLLSMASTLIAQAENEFKDLTHAGGQKFTWVCEKLYNGMPKAIRPLISYQDVEDLVQATFDEMQTFGVLQLELLEKRLSERYSSAAD